MPKDLLAYLNPTCPKCGETGKVDHARGPGGERRPAELIDLPFMKLMKVPTGEEQEDSCGDDGRTDRQVASVVTPTVHTGVIPAFVAGIQPSLLWNSRRG